MKVIFISGKYRGKTWQEIDDNIQLAKQASIKLWQQGYAVICPHLNTAHFDGLADDKVWLEGDIAILKLCQAVFMLKNWRNSDGAQKEHAIALRNGLEIIYQETEE